MFVSSAKRVCFQHQKGSSPNQHKTRSSLAINAFDCSVILYSEVSSRGYLVASDDAFVCSVVSYSEVKIGLETPQKEQTRGEKFLKKIHLE